MHLTPNNKSRVIYTYIKSYNRTFSPKPMCAQTRTIRRITKSLCAREARKRTLIDNHQSRGQIKTTKKCGEEEERTYLCLQPLC